MNNGKVVRFLGTDDSVNVCDCCGKTELKYTVAIELEAGEVVHYGRICAARALALPVAAVDAGTAAADAEKSSDAVNAAALRIAFLVQATWGTEVQDSLRARGCHYMAHGCEATVDHYTRLLEAALAPKRDAARLAKLEKLHTTCTARAAAMARELTK